MHRFYRPTHILFALLVFLIVGYQPATTAPVDKMQPSTPSITWTPSITPRPTITPRRIIPTSTKNRITPTLTPTPPLISGPLSETGPWVMFYSKTENAFMAANDDGTGKKVILRIKSKWREIAGSSSNLVSIITEMPDIKAEYPYNLALLIINLPNAKVEKTIPLVLHPESQDINLWAIGDSVRYGMTWSPDGRYLAFIGAIDKPSTELYIYDRLSNNYSRLTYNATFARAPQWSPNSQWIIFYEEESTDGPQTEIVWSANIKTREMNEVYDAGGGIKILDWLNPESFVSIKLSGNEFSNLYFSDLSSRISTRLMPEDVTLLWNELSATVNTQGKQVAYTATSIISGSDFHGTYIASLSDPTPKPATQEILPLYWMSGINKYVGSFYHPNPCEIVTFTTNGYISCIKNHDSNSITGLVVSPDGQWLVTSTSNGLLLYDNKLKQTLLENGEGCDFGDLGDFNTAITWRPDSKAFVCHSKKATYYVDLKTLSVHPITVFGEPGYIDIIWNSDSTGFFFYKNNNLGYHDISNGASSYIAVEVDHIEPVGGNQ
jgi:hypothetical protein